MSAQRRFAQGGHPGFVHQAQARAQRRRYRRAFTGRAAPPKRPLEKQQSAEKKAGAGGGNERSKEIRAGRPLGLRSSGAELGKRDAAGRERWT